MSNSTGCAACKYLRRRCAKDCALAPYFSTSHPERFAPARIIFGATDVSRMLQNLAVEQLNQRANAIASEAYRRVRDPVYAVQSNLAETQAQVALHSVQQQQHQQENQVQLENHQYNLDNTQQFGLDQGPSSFQSPPNFP
ncbi:LOB domain-containing protein 12-like [Asparagus officinalis]|uniref:LOB domain-containing protein 12-like n=1 Tax=Asparagus officinalis TaxID=4686 RepID=UPI00098E5DF1|nr:LOB domain-containing protein 12-like [Asparagus officinalis]